MVCIDKHVSGNATGYSADIVAIHASDAAAHDFIGVCQNVNQCVSVVARDTLNKVGNLYRSTL
jgi:adenosylcobinamide amidohydrolase